MTTSQTSSVPSDSSEHDPSPDVLVDLVDGVMTVRFNRPGSLNALTRDSIRLLAEAVDRAQAEAGVLVLTGDDRSFCSGADLAAGARDAAHAAAVSKAAAGTAGNGTAGGRGSGGGTSGADEEARAQYESLGLAEVNALVLAMRDSRIPLVSAVAGPAAGLGCSLALMCDYVIMSESAYLMLAFTRIGLMPDGGATQIVAASAGRHRAMRMALEAEKLPAAKAQDWGLATEVVPEGTHLTRAHEIAARLAAGPTQSLGTTRRAINAATLGDLEETLERENRGQGELRVSADFAEGLTAFVAKRTPRFGR